MNPNIPPAKKLHIKTWGCQMNVYDSARMADVVAPLGYAPTEEMAGADLVIFNTCHIREKATEKLFSELGRVREHQQEKAGQGGRMLLAVAGCVAQAEGAEIQRRAPYVDMVFGPQTYHRLPEMIAQVTRKAGKVLDTDFPPEAKFDHLPQQQANTGVSAFLSVQEGCDKFCSFCVVPYTRGAEYSRPATAIIAEAERLVKNGAREITLLGQNVNAYHGIPEQSPSPLAGEVRWGGAPQAETVGIFSEPVSQASLPHPQPLPRGEGSLCGNPEQGFSPIAQGEGSLCGGLAGLLRRLAVIPDLRRLRYMTSHPRDMDDALIAAHGDLPQLMPFLHLPVQSGSDRVLEMMNRKHTADDYRRIIDKLRRARPDIALSSDFIVGFPGETDEDFKETLRLVRDVGFVQAFSFKYSRRPGTPAAVLTDQVAEQAQDDRLQELQTLLRQQQDAFNQACVGKIMPVLCDGESRREGMVFGRTPYLQAIHVAGPPRLIGHEIMVKITEAGTNSLKGAVVTDA